MSDMTRPIKAKLTEYLKLEAPYKIKFGIILLPPLSDAEKKAISEIDDKMLSYD